MQTSPYLFLCWPPPNWMNCEVMHRLRKHLQTGSPNPKTGPPNSGDYLLPKCGGDQERARSYLQRIRTHAADEAQLRDRVNFAVRKIFYPLNDSELDVDAVRSHLGELLLENISREIDRQTILASLASRQVGLRDWSQDKSVRNQIEHICDQYVGRPNPNIINGKLLSLSGSRANPQTIERQIPAKRLSRRGGVLAVERAVRSLRLQ